MGNSRRSDILVEYSRRFGMIAVNRGYVTKTQLKEALSEQIDDDLGGRPHQLLGKIFFEKHLMNLNQIEQVLDELVMEKIRQKGSKKKKN